MLRYPSLDCKLHICQRITEAVGAGSYCSFNGLENKLQLNHKLSYESPTIDFQIPIKDLRKMKIPDIHCILSMKPDGIIKDVSKNVEKEEKIVFHIEKNQLLESVLKTTITPDCEMAFTPQHKVLVEFSSPNIAKPFHFGHLRSTIVGNFVANIVGLSHNVKRINFLGDWGTQIGYIKIGLDSMNVPDIFFLENPMKALYKAYSYAYNKGDMLKKAKEIFAELETNCSDWSGQWKKIRSITEEHLKKTYSSLGIVFDEYLYESDYRSEKIVHVIDLLKDEGLIGLENDCLVMNMEGKKIPLMKSDGTTLYLARDISSALDRLNKNDCDTLMYVVDKSQTEHLNALNYAIYQLMKKRIIHVPFGRVTGMSTRRGTSIFLDDILNEVVRIMANEQLKSPNTRTSDLEVTRILGVTSLMIYVLRHSRNRDFQFSWTNALQTLGDTGNKLQYTHCRLCSLKKKCGAVLPKEVDITIFREPVAFELIFELARFQDVLISCQCELESSFLINYLFRLCNIVSRSLKVLPIKGQPTSIAEQRLLLFHTAQYILSSSMKILGLQPLEEM